MNPVGLGTDAYLNFYGKTLLYIMWIFLGTACTLWGICIICVIWQWLLPRDSRKNLASGGEYEQHEIQ